MLTYRLAFSILLAHSLFFQLSTHAESSAGRERLLAPIEKIQVELIAFSTNSKIEMAQVKRLRHLLFRLQGLARIYERSLGENFSTIRQDAKSLEDAIGRYALVEEILASATEKGVDKDTLRKLTQKRDRAEITFREFLHKEDWIGSPRTQIDRIRELVIKAKFRSNAKDRNQVVEETRRLVQKISSSHYDLNLIEEGVHELRRQLRWISIYLLAADDIFAIPTTSTCSKRLDLRKNKYVELPRLSLSDATKSTCFVSECAVMSIAYYVEEFGKLKDTAQLEEIQDSNQREEAILKVIEEARDLRKRLDQEEALSQVESELESCL